MEAKVKWQMPPSMVKQELFDLPPPMVSLDYGGVSYTKATILHSAVKDLTVELQGGTKCQVSKLVFAAASEKYRSHLSSNPDIDSIMCDLTEEEFKLAERFMLEGWIPEDELEITTKACSLLGMNMLNLKLNKEPVEVSEDHLQLIMTQVDPAEVKSVPRPVEAIVPVVAPLEVSMNMEEEEEEEVADYVVGYISEDDFEYNDVTFYEEKESESEESSDEDEPKKKRKRIRPSKKSKAKDDDEKYEPDGKRSKDEAKKEKQAPDHCRVPGSEEDLKLTTFDIMCVFCSRGIKSNEDLPNHRSECKPYNAELRFEGKGKKKSCDICNDILPDKAALKEHLAIHKKSCLYLECMHCGVVADKSGLRAHFKEMGNQHNCYCVQCPVKVNTYSEYVSHVETEHLGFWRYHCGICLDTFDNEEQVMEHMKDQEHPKGGTCTRCFNTFTTLQAHYRQVHGDKKFKCAIEKCLAFKAGYATPEELKYHMKYSHTAKFTCEHCNEAFGKKTFLKVHIERRHIPKVQDDSKPKKVPKRIRVRESKADKEMKELNENPLEVRVPGCEGQMKLPSFTTMCVFCHQGMDSKEELFEHRVVCHLYNEELVAQGEAGEEKMICDSCNIICSNVAALEQHLEKQHKDCVFLECPHCGFVADKINLRRHFREMGNEHNVYCVQCFYKVNTFDDYIKHVDADHNGVWAYHCGYCLDRFGSQEEVMQHMKLESHPKSGKCRKCHSEMQNILQAHYRRVHGPKKFWCDDCSDARFSTIKDYEYHRKSKHGTKFSCEFCGMSFGKQYALKLHIQTNHTRDEELPFQCRFCQKGFARQQKLEYHENTHLNIKPHSCHQCGNSYASRNNLDAHLKTHDPMARMQAKRSKNGPKKVKTYEGYLGEHGIEKQKKSYFCKLCNTSYTGAHATCSGPRVIQVQTRGKRGKGTRSMPIVDMRVDQPFNPRCNLCSAVLENRRAMALHMAVHNIPR